MDNKKAYTYILIREDISYEQQIVQASHAALEAGIRYGDRDHISYLILLSVANQEELLEAA
jgi:hypothetical protein